MTFGQIPNPKVGISSDRRIIDSRLETSSTYPRYPLFAPKQIRLNNQIEYPALKMIPVLMISPTRGERWKVPDKDKNSPTQLLDKGTAIFAIVKAKK